MLLLDTDIHLFGEGGELLGRDHAEQVDIGMRIDVASRYLASRAHRPVQVQDTSSRFAELAGKC